jgi:serine-type D-Ala-D-Ala carboxypeptidase/endopeptidase
MRAMSRSPAQAALALLLASLVACSHPASSPTTPTPATPRDPVGPHAAAVAAQIQPYFDAELLSGAVVGLVDGDHTEIYGYGRRTDDKDADRPDGRTVFEIGTLTQVFTSILLADAVARGEVAFDLPVANLVPLGVTVPTAEGQVITLEMLATHRSGLPGMPRSLALKQFAADPYNGYDADQLYLDLVAGRLEAVPGTIVHYSSWGVGLLGFVLARKIGMSYSEALVDRVAKPLGLDDTRVDVSAAMTARLATGHTEDLAPVPPWHFSSMAGAAGLHSTVQDLTRVIHAELAAAKAGKGPLADRLRATQEIRVPADPRSLGLGWWIEKDGRYWHNGASGGHHVFLELDPARGVGVVVIASTSSSLVDRLGGALMDLMTGAPPKPIVFPDPATFKPLAGRYKIGDTDATVEVRGKRLYLVQPGQPPTRLEPLSPTEFFIEEIQAPLAFELEQGKVMGLVIFVGGQRLEGKRTGDLPPPAPTAPAAPAPAPIAPAPHR